MSQRKDIMKSTPIPFISVLSGCLAHIKGRTPFNLDYIIRLTVASTGLCLLVSITSTILCLQWLSCLSTLYHLYLYSVVALLTSKEEHPLHLDYIIIRLIATGTCLCLFVFNY